MAKPDASHLIAELRQHGVTDYRIEMGGVHPRLVFQWRGREVAYIFPGSPSESWRGNLNGVSALRKVMGVRRRPAPKSARPSKQRATTPLPAAPVLTERPDPWQALAALRERMGVTGD